MEDNENILSSERREELLTILRLRFEANTNRHEGLDWAGVRARLQVHGEKIWSLDQMERTGGEPDVIDYDPRTGAYVFYDCSAESPAGRRNLCYDQEALESRRKNKPKGSAVGMADVMGIGILTEQQYHALQERVEVDVKTSSWILTPHDIRELGGALFCDRRYSHVFVYHNGAESYYASRGFRGSLRV